MISLSERRKPFEPELILIPAGEFLMGSDPSRDEEARDDEQPQHTVYLADYYIARTPVTNAQYAPFVEATLRELPRHWENREPPAGREDDPVVYVTWYDAMAYCRWLAEATGKIYRLPSEAEWEKAARGTDGRIYPWGDEAPDESRCNFNDLRTGTTPVGQYSPKGDSPYGCVDMAGNAWEWTRSLHQGYPYDPGDGRESPDAGSIRVLRGGSFYSYERGVRCAYRHRFYPDLTDGSSGFRVIVAPGL